MVEVIHFPKGGRRRPTPLDNYVEGHDLYDLAMAALTGETELERRLAVSILLERAKRA